jgi:hypothetical protein
MPIGSTGGRRDGGGGGTVPRVLESGDMVRARSAVDVFEELAGVLFGFFAGVWVVEIGFVTGWGKLERIVKMGNERD